MVVTSVANAAARWSDLSVRVLNTLRVMIFFDQPSYIGNRCIRPVRVTVLRTVVVV